MDRIIEVRLQQSETHPVATILVLKENGMIEHRVVDVDKSQFAATLSQELEKVKPTLKKGEK